LQVPAERLKPSWLPEALMELQYRFPLTPTPYADVASRIGISLDVLIERLRKLKNMGLLKRVGFYLNYRAERKKAALIALAVRDPDAATRFLAERLQVTHSYIRDHLVYNLWIVGKHPSQEEIVRAAEKAARLYGDGRWVVLWGVRTHRLSVKYDLYRGVSRAGPYSTVAQNPPTPQQLGVPMELARALRILPLEPRPYRSLAQSYGMSEDELLDKVKEMLKAGVLGDPGAALDGHRLGFSYNVMYTLAPRSEGQLTSLCSWVNENIEEATHIVERAATPRGAWKHLCYFMFHAVDEKLSKPLEEKLSKCPLLESYMKLRSLRDVLPGVVR